MTTSYLDDLGDRSSCLTHGALSVSIADCSSRLEQLQVDYSEYSPVIHDKLVALKKLIQRKLPMITEKKKDEPAIDLYIKCLICTQECNRREILFHIEEHCTISMYYIPERICGSSNRPKSLYQIRGKYINCIPCKVNMNSYEMLSSHELSDDHSQRVLIDFEKRYMFCITCQKRVLKTIHTYHRHVYSKLHQQLHQFKPDDWKNEKVGILFYQNQARCLPCSTNIPWKLFNSHGHIHNDDWVTEKAFCTICLKYMPIKKFPKHAFTQHSRKHAVDRQMLTCPLCFAEGVEGEFKSHLRSCIAINDEKIMLTSDVDVNYALNAFIKSELIYPVPDPRDFPFNVSAASDAAEWLEFQARMAIRAASSAKPLFKTTSQAEISKENSSIPSHSSSNGSLTRPLHNRTRIKISDPQPLMTPGWPTNTSTIPAASNATSSIKIHRPTATVKPTVQRPTSLSNNNSSYSSVRVTPTVSSSPQVSSPMSSHSSASSMPATTPMYRSTPTYTPSPTPSKQEGKCIIS